jgi:putative peptide zinc metalloprotease protein
VAYTREDFVQVFPFTRQPDGDEVIIGRPDISAFLALPAEAVEILDHLSAGKSVGAAQDEFARAHGETPDVDDLLSYLEQKGFVWPRNGSNGSAAAPRSDTRMAAPAAAPAVKYHFEDIPETTARRFFGPRSLRLYALIVALAVAAVAARPSLVPGRYSLFFAQDRAAKFLTLTVLTYMTLFIHEFCHLLAARAVGVKSRIGISHRLWFLVAETDLTGLWAVPKEKRYLPILAGPISDCVSGSLLFLLLYAESEGLLHMPPIVGEMARALIFLYMMRLVWQCFFFMRTDFYFAFTNFFGCKNLMGDTQGFLRNQIARLFPAVRASDQSHIPKTELRVIRWYSLLWLLGRGFAIATLFLVTVPVIVKYFGAIAGSLRLGYSSDPYGYIDSLIVGLVSLAPVLLGLWLWLANLLKRRFA